MKPCTLIATVPSFANMANVERAFAEPCVSELRFNTGSDTPFSIEETIEKLKDLAIKNKKKVWIDLKGRQLRITKWADPIYSCIELNHKIELVYPAQVHFRGGDIVNVMHIKDGNKIFVDPLPRQALGAGQAVNIIAKELNIEGYLTPTDKKYLMACRKHNMLNIMASFVEKPSDISEILCILPNACIISKIESLKGIKLISQSKIGNLMAARDDLYIQCGQNYDIINLLKVIIHEDSDAICASKIFETLEMHDFMDVEIMYCLGYRKFMLDDNVCNYNFEKAITAWKEFING